MHSDCQELAPHVCSRTGVAFGLALLVLMVFGSTIGWTSMASAQSATPTDERADEPTAPSENLPNIPPGMGIRLLEVPSDLAADPRAQIYVIDHVAPGTVIERRFELTNGDPDPFTVSLYAVVATITDDGFVGDQGRRQNDLASWVTVEPMAATLQPGERVSGTMRVEVPLDAAPGEQYAVMFSERGADPGADGVALATRVGIRLYVSVGDGAPPAADFQIDSFTAERTPEGAPVLLASVTNTGGRALDFTGEVALSDGPGGLSAGPFNVTNGTSLAPGGTTDVQVVLDPALPAGPWLARLDLQSGLLERSAETTLTFPDAGVTGEAVPVQTLEPDDGEGAAGGVGRGWIPWIAGAIPVVGFPLLMLWRRRRRKDANVLEDDVAVAAAPAIPPVGVPMPHPVAAPSPPPPPLSAPVATVTTPAPPPRGPKTPRVAPPPPPA